MDDLTRWRDSALEVVSLLEQFPRRADNQWLRDFPSGSCSIVSYAVGRLLLERHNEQWLLESRSGYAHKSHTWLTRCPSQGPVAAIDATLHQFPDIASDPYIGWGASPASRHFQTMSTDPTYVALVDGGWHHGQTTEVYQWLFPQLGLRAFDRQGSLRDLLPEEIAFPPVAQLADRMVDARESVGTEAPYAFIMSWSSSRTLLRNSDASMKRGGEKHDEYLNHPVFDHQQISDDLIYLVPAEADAPADSPAFLGDLSRGRHEFMTLTEILAFDPASFGNADSGSPSSAVHL